MSKPIWLLDVDGVLNADSKKPPSHMPYNWLVFDQKDSNGKTFPMLIAQEVVDFIDEMSDIVDIVWCSTWQADANLIGKRIGLKGFTWIDRNRPMLKKSHLHWKRATFEALQKTGGKIIWTDDDIRRFYFYPLKISFDNSLIVTPYLYEGLAPKHLDLIRSFVENGQTKK